MEFWAGLAFTYLPLKRFYKYILKRLIGGFLKHDIDLEQLEVQLYRGIVQLKALELDVAQFNLAMLGAGFLLHFVSGFVGCIKMDIPWRHLLSDNCKIYISGVHFVLAKGSPEADLADPHSQFQGDASPGYETQATNAAPERPSSGRYSDEGIEALSRLVKHVLSRMEVCFNDTSMSILAPPAESLLRARAASVVVFSEQARDGIEDRTVRVTGIRLSLVPLVVALEEGDVSTGDPDGEIVLLSTDAPQAESSPDTLSIRRHNPCGSEGVSADATRSAGVRLDMELCVNAILIAMGPGPWHAISECMTALDLLMEGEPELSDFEVAVDTTCGAAHQSSAAQGALMFQSLMESSLPGNPSHNGFWYELYNLFESDSQLEAVAGREELAEESGEDLTLEGLAEEVRLHGLDKGLGTDASDREAVTGCTLRVAVAQVGFLVIMRDGNADTLPKIADMRLTPGPAMGTTGDQLQVCIQQWDVTVELPTIGDQRGDTASSPTVTMLVRTIVAHMHNYTHPDSPAVEPTIHPPSTTASVVRKAGSTPPEDSEIDPSMFCSAISHTGASVVQGGAHTPSMPSCHCSETESVGGMASEEESFLHSAASSIHSFDASTLAHSTNLTCRETSEPAAIDPVDSHIGPGGLQSCTDPLVAPCQQEHDTQSVPDFEEILKGDDDDDQDECRSEKVEEEEDDDEDGDEDEGEEDEDEDEDADEDEAYNKVKGFSQSLKQSKGHRGQVDSKKGDQAESIQAEDVEEEKEDENLEAVFFNRSRSLRDALLCTRPRSKTAHSSNADEGRGGAADMANLTGNSLWHQTTSNFKSKRLLHFAPVPNPEESLATSTATSSTAVPRTIPRWTLPPPGHPIWDGLRLVSSHDGNQVRAEWACSPAVSTSNSQPSGRIECLPITLSLCAESVGTLAKGLAWLKSPAWRKRPPANAQTKPGGSSDTPILRQVFDFVSITPMLRIELMLSAAPQVPYGVVCDLVAPRCFAQPRSKDAASGGTQMQSRAATFGGYEESLYVELGDVRSYLVFGDIGSCTSADPTTQGAGAVHPQTRCSESAANSDDVPNIPGQCMTILSFCDDPDDRGNTAGSSAAVQLRLLRRLVPVAPAVLQPASLVPLHPADEAAEEQPASFALRDWTKISLPAPAAKGRPSRSSLMLQDLRHVSQRLLRSTKVSRRAAAHSVLATYVHSELFDDADQHERASPSGAKAKPRAGRAPTDSASDAQTAGMVPAKISWEGLQEAEVTIPKMMRLSIDRKGFLALQESIVNICNRHSENLPGQPSSPQSNEKKSATAGSEVVPLACTLALKSICLELHGQNHERSLDFSAPCKTHSSDESHRCCIDFVQCRLIQHFDSSMKLCGLGRELRLESASCLPHAPREQLIRSWFLPISRASAFSSCCEAVDADEPGANFTSLLTTFPSSYPWEARQVQRRTCAVSQAFLEVEQGEWRETQSLLLQVEHRKIGSIDHTDASLKVSRLLLHAYPHLYQIYSTLFHFFTPSGSSQQPPRTSCGSSSTYQISILDCLVDLPSEAFAQTYSIAGLNAEAARQASVRCADGDKWRSVVHVDGLDLSVSASQASTAPSVRAFAGEFNFFLVDHPCHLSNLELSSSSVQPAVLLSSLGYAHILEVSRTTASLEFQSTSGLPDPHKFDLFSDTAFGARPVERNCHSVEVVVGSIEAAVCADSLRCLLCLGMEVSDLFYASPQQPSFTDAVRQDEPEESVRCQSVTKQQFGFSPSSQSGQTSAVNILQNIDMFAFEPSSGSDVDECGSVGIKEPEKETSQKDPPVESCLIEDYIRTQMEQQSPRSPVRAAPEGVSIEDLELMELPEPEIPTCVGEPPSALNSSVTVCLLNPSSYSEDHLQELCIKDQAAWREVEELYPLRSPPSKDYCKDADKAPTSTQPQQVLHQDGSAAVIHVNPAEVAVIQDHFAGSNPEMKEEVCWHPAQRKPPMELQASFCFDVVRLSLYGGTDFADGAKACQGGQRSRRKMNTSVALQLQHSTVKLMSSSASTDTAQPLSVQSSFQRRLLVSAKDFAVLDRVQGSVFSNLLSYFEDERRCPRSSHVDMLRLSIDEVAPATGGTSEVETIANEYCVDVQLLPLRLTLDQDAVDFLVEFVQICTLPTYVEEDPHDAAVAMTMDSAPQELQAEASMAATSGIFGSMAGASSSLHNSARAPSAAWKEPFFQRFSVGALLLSVDYRAKRLDVNALRRGELWELINLLPLLEGLQIAFGSIKLQDLSGFNQVTEQVVSSWSADLNRTQILRSLTGVTPIRSFANIGGGFAEMVLEPLKQYRTGGDSLQVSRAVLRGLFSFLKNVTVESIDLTERIFVGTQSALEYVNMWLSDVPRQAQAASVSAPSPSLSRPSEQFSGTDGSSIQSWTWTSVERGAADFLQPGGATEGLLQAYTRLSRSMGEARKAVVVRPLLELRRGAPREQVLRTVVSGIPMCVLRPAIGATAAATTALRGVRNSVDPLHKQEMAKKYKSPE